MGPLDGIRVIEVTRGISGQFAGMLLADWGADVVRLEGDESEEVHSHPAYAVWNRNKRSVLRSDTALDGLASAADLLLVDDPNFDVDALTERHQGLATSIVRSPSFLGYVADPTDLVHAHVGLMRTHLPSDGSDRPVFHVSPASAYGAGWLAAMGALTVLLQRRRGRHAVHSSTSQVEGGLAMLQFSIALPTDSPSTGVISNDGDAFRITSPAIRFYRTKDERWVLIGAATPTMWVKMCTALKRYDLLSDAQYEGAPWGIPTAAARIELLGHLADTVSAWKADELIQHLNDHGVIAAPGLTSAELLQQPFARAEEIIVTADCPGTGKLVAVGTPMRFSAHPAPELRSAPDYPRQDTTAIAWPARTPSKSSSSSDGPPLAGIRVLDFASFVAAPEASKHLADLGADVIKVEPVGGDGLRQVGYSFSAVNFGKRFVTHDLNSPEGRSAVDGLIRDADIIIHNFPPKLQSRTGFTWEHVHALNPRAIVAQLNGWANVGSFANRPSVDGTFQAFTGACMSQGGNLEPRGFYGGLVDNSAAMGTACACIAALLDRTTSGTGQLITTTLVKIAAMIQSHRLVDAGQGVPSSVLGKDPLGRSQLSRLYEAADGWVYLEARTDEAWTGLAREMGLPPTPYQPSLAAETTEVIASGPIAVLVEKFCKGRTVTAVLETCARAGVAAVRVNQITELPGISDLTGSQALRLIQNPDWGGLWQTGKLIAFGGSASVRPPSADVGTGN